jgi:hypothetical protein
MPASDAAALVAAFVAGLALMLLLPFANASRAPKPIASADDAETFWPVLCGIDETRTAAPARLDLARQLASRSDVRATAIRRAALAEERDPGVREALIALAPVIGEA